MSSDSAIESVVLSDAVSLSRAIQARAVSCVEVMTTFLDRIETYNPAVNAIVALQPREVLMRQAAERDADLTRGLVRGALHGLPLAVKDLSMTKGIVTSYGSPLFRDNVPAVDGIMVERLKAAGAIIIGKTNVPEFGFGSQTYNSVYGATGNAYDPKLTAGGSSGGAAVALALRLLPLADGSDMMGSLRNPAAFNNVFGFRPSFGRVPAGPADDVFFAQLGYEGPMARSVTDLALLLSVQAGYDERSPLSIQQDPARFREPLQRDFSGVRLGWFGDFGGYLAMEPGVLEVCRMALAGFRDIGCVVDEDADAGFPLERLWDSWLTLRQVWTAGRHLPVYRDPARRDLLKPEIQWEIEGGLKASGLDVQRASVARSDWYQALHHRLFDRYDFLLAPSAQVFPFDKTLHWPREVGGRAMDTYHRWMEATSIWSIAGVPCLNVPAGFGLGGLPMGLQIIGRNHADFAVLQLAHAYEQATGWTERVLPPLAR